MANELTLDYGMTGRTVYALITNSTGKIWNGTAFETILAANWAAYAVALTEQSTTGVYVGDFPAAIVDAGNYRVSYRWQSGVNPATTDAVIYSEAFVWGGNAIVVSVPGALPAYCTAADVVESMPDSNLGNTYDTLLTKLALRASRLIDALLSRKEGAFAVSTDVTRYFDGSGAMVQKIGEIADVPTEVAVSINGLLSYTPWQQTDYLCYPLNAPDQGIPYNELHINIYQLSGAQAQWYAFPKSVRVTGKFGFSTTPPDLITQATIVQTARWFKRGQNGWQDSGGNPALAQPTYTKKLDSDLVDLLLPAFRQSPL